MKKILGLICAVLIGIMPATAQKSAKNVLDATANAFTKGGGIEATFKADQFNKNNQAHDYMVQWKNAMELYQKQ